MQNSEDGPDLEQMKAKDGLVPKIMKAEDGQEADLNLSDAEEGRLQ